LRRARARRLDHNGISQTGDAPARAAFKYSILYLSILSPLSRSTGWWAE
jgi:hypothetical protein